MVLKLAYFLWYFPYRGTSQDRENSDVEFEKGEIFKNPCWQSLFT